MLVGDIMRRDVVTVGPKTRWPEAMGLLGRRGIRHLPVLAEGRLVGIVSDRDFKVAMVPPGASRATLELTYLLDALTIGEIMTRTVITVTPEWPVEEAARLMTREKISALPVTQDGRLVGIVTETDVVGLFMRALGAAEPSSRLDVVMGEGRSALAEIVRTIEATGAVVCSVVTLRTAELREAVVRVATIDPRAAIQALQAAGYTVRAPSPSLTR
ncbi:MAG TPA: CBS and ACT domain-containing protein [Methylomirabilota bacterium]|jgi:acetoin utilization protein AcuB